MFGEVLYYKWSLTVTNKFNVKINLILNHFICLGHCAPLNFTYGLKGERGAPGPKGEPGKAGQDGLPGDKGMQGVPVSCFQS